MLTKNQLVSLTITDLTHEGNGVGRIDGMAVFVPFSAVGDCLTVRIVKVLPRYAFGAIVSVDTPAAERIVPDCPIYGKCGSCSLRHLSYEQELRVKNGWVQENIRRIGKQDITLPPALPSPQQDRYRNKAIYPIALVDGKPVIGFYAKRSHRIIPCADCMLHPDFFARAVEAMGEWLAENHISIYDEISHTGLVRAIYFRHAEATGEWMVTVIANGDALPHWEELQAKIETVCPPITSFFLNVNREKTNVLLGKKCILLAGKPTITDTLCGVKFSLSPLSFYQVNRQGAERLYTVAAEFADLQGGEVLLDLYCGAGTIGLSMAKKASQLIGVEIVPPAVENARQNALDNGIENARFLCADAAAAAQQLEEEGIRPDVILLDPPRKGCEPALIDTVVRMQPDRVVMVSCDSATAARDIALFAAQGYHPQKMQAVDMFPRTGHVETCVLLSHKNS